MGKMTGQEFIYEVNRPEYPVNDQPENGMVIVPADHHGINSKQKI